MSAVAPNGPHERLRTIEHRISDNGSVRIDELASALGVSEMTIRRDLEELEALGVARRVRGGAVAVGPELFAERHRHHAKAKARIAAKLLPLVPDRGTVAFDASTTVHRLAADLPGARDLVAVTNGLDTFASLSGKTGINAIISGGSREPRTGSLVGTVALRGTQDFLFDLFVCSAAAVDPDVGPSEASLAEAEIKRALAGMASRTVLAVDQSKLGSRAQARTFPLGDLDLLVTDLDPTDDRLAPYRASGVEIR